MDQLFVVDSFTLDRYRVYYRRVSFKDIFIEFYKNSIKILPSDTTLLEIPVGNSSEYSKGFGKTNIPRNEEFQ